MARGAGPADRSGAVADASCLPEEYDIWFLYDNMSGKFELKTI